MSEQSAASQHHSHRYGIVHDRVHYRGEHPVPSEFLNIKCTTVQPSPSFGLRVLTVCTSGIRNNCDWSERPSGRGQPGNSGMFCCGVTPGSTEKWDKTSCEAYEGTLMADNS